MIVRVAQCVVAEKKAMIGIIRKGIENIMPNIIMLLYKLKVRLHLEFWSLHLKMDIQVKPQCSEGLVPGTATDTFCILQKQLVTMAGNESI